MPNVQIPPGLSESDDVDHDQTQGGTEGNPHGDSAASADVSSIQSSADVDHDNTSGGTAGNPHADSAASADVSPIQGSGDVIHDSTSGGTVSDAHHGRYSNSEARNSVTNTVDAADLRGDSGSSGQILETDGSNTSWASPPGIDGTDVTDLKNISEDRFPGFTYQNTTGTNILLYWSGNACQGYAGPVAANNDDEFPLKTGDRTKNVAAGVLLVPDGWYYQFDGDGTTSQPVLRRQEL